VNRPTNGGPVFVLTVHRGGGTVLTRILNCHPRLVIWGEHVGFINRLAEIDDMITRVGRLMARKTDEVIAEYVTFPDQRLTEFDPWVNPFDYNAFSRSCHDMIEAIFARGLHPGQRWGFKEIRYHRTLTAQFLIKLFPESQFVIMRRDVCDVAVSTILASWSLRWFPDYREAMPAEVAEAIVRDVTYAILAIESGLEEVQQQLGPRCRRLDYTELLDPTVGFVAPVFKFLELDVSDEVITRIRRVLEVRAGATDQEVRFGGILTRDFIRKGVTAILPELRAEIARNGIDRTRLIAREGRGRYSFLAGDHTLRDRGSEFSSLF
jgi:Sulfotransferase family